MKRDKQIVSQELSNCKEEIVHLRREITFLQVITNMRMEKYAAFFMVEFSVRDFPGKF